MRTTMLKAWWKKILHQNLQQKVLPVPQQQLLLRLSLYTIRSWTLLFGKTEVRSMEGLLDRYISNQCYSNENNNITLSLFSFTQYFFMYPSIYKSIVRKYVYTIIFASSFQIQIVFLSSKRITLSGRIIKEYRQMNVATSNLFHYRIFQLLSLRKLKHAVSSEIVIYCAIWAYYVIEA